jgi:hypothetical protein
MSGDHDLEYATDLVSMYRCMRTGDHARYNQDYMRALCALRGQQRRLGLTEPALATSLELVAVCRRMTESDERRYLPMLAWLLQSAAADQPDPRKALPLVAESVALLVAAADLDPGLRPHLMDAYIALSVRQRELNRPAESAQTCERALRIGRSLVREDPRTHRLDMLGCLHRVGLGMPHSEQTLAWCDEAVRLARQIAVDDLDLGLPLLVETLLELSAQFAAAGLILEARATFVEATAIQRHLPTPLAPEASQLPPAPAAPDTEFHDRVDALVAVSDGVCELLRQHKSDPAAAASLPEWLGRQADLLAERGRFADAEQARAHQRRLRTAGVPLR